MDRQTERWTDAWIFDYLLLLYEFKKVIKKDGQTDWMDQPELRFVNVVF